MAALQHAGPAASHLSINIRPVGWRVAIPHDEAYAVDLLLKWHRGGEQEVGRVEGQEHDVRVQVIRHPEVEVAQEGGAGLVRVVCVRFHGTHDEELARVVPGRKGRDLSVSVVRPRNIVR